MFDLFKVEIPVDLGTFIDPDWNKQAEVSDSISPVIEGVIEILDAVPGMTPANSRDFKSATPIFSLRDGSVVKKYGNPIGVPHIFIVDESGRMVYGGYIEFWKSGTNYAPLYQALETIKREFK